jgi:uncharacterized protein YbjQ (UPF0145 family)
MFPCFLLLFLAPSCSNFLTALRRNFIPVEEIKESEVNHGREKRESLQVSKSYEGELLEAREEALKEMEERAANLGANAVIGVDVDYEMLGQGGSMLMVTASGTAVVIE